MKTRVLLAAALAAGTALFLAGCQPALWVGMQFVYNEAGLPAGQIKKDLTYVEGPSADPEKHRLDLFLPASSEEGWPTVIFAARGIGAAVINYRLLGDGVPWPAQIEDVARVALDLADARTYALSDDSAYYATTAAASTHARTGKRRPRPHRSSPRPRRPS